MSRLIDADALWMDIIHAMDYCDDILEIIEQQPTVEKKTGKWVHAYDCDCFQCNQCGTPSIVAHPYCCICGSRNEVEDE